MKSTSRYGDRIRAHREIAGYSQAVLAQKAGLHTNTIQRLEAEDLKPSMTTLENLARVFKVKMADLLPGGGK